MNNVHGTLKPVKFCTSFAPAPIIRMLLYARQYVTIYVIPYRVDKEVNDTPVKVQVKR